jgi:CheY-like chemotaxis protein
MDLKMPLMDGFEAVKLIKEFRPELPIIAQTAFSSKKDKEKVFASGFSGFLSKPISKESLSDVLNLQKEQKRIKESINFRN